jgi:hypothetical protein
MTYLVSFHIGVDLSKPTVNVCTIFLTYQPCGNVVSTCQWQLLWKMTNWCLFILASIYPNQQLICLQNTPNLSTMWKCGLHISATTALKNDLCDVFSYWRGFIQTNNWYICKVFLIYQPCGNVVSTYRWQLLWKIPYLVSFHIGVDLSKPTINMFVKCS